MVVEVWEEEGGDERGGAPTEAVENCSGLPACPAHLRSGLRVIASSATKYLTLGLLLHCVSLWLRTSHLWRDA